MVRVPVVAGRPCACTPHRISNSTAVSPGAAGRLLLQRLVGGSVAWAPCSGVGTRPWREILCGKTLSQLRCMPVSVRGTWHQVRLVQLGPGHVTPACLAPVQRQLAGHAPVCVYLWHNFHFYILQTTCYHATCYNTTYCVQLTRLRAVCYREGSRDNSVCVRAAGAVGSVTHTAKKIIPCRGCGKCGASTYNTKNTTQNLSILIFIYLKYTFARRATQGTYSWCRCVCVCMCMCSRVWQRLSLRG